MTKPYFIWAIIIGILFLSGAGFGGYTLKKQVDSAREEIGVLDTKLASTTNTLTQAEQENTFLFEQLQNEQRRNNDLEERVEEAEDVLGIIVKIQNTDPELLQKYSKVYFLNEHYRPEKMEQIPDKWVVEDLGEEYIHEKIWPFLEDMLKDAERDGLDLRIISAFRSFDEQAQLKGQYTVQYGTGANTFSADQGYSEHQLGTTVDVSTDQLGTSFTSIDQTEAFSWLEKNAHKYGFILSYPQNNQYYQYEPWHWRFVGRDLARDLERKNESFYDLDQREIDEYIVEFFD